MSDILLNYAFEVSLATSPVSPATAFLRKVLCIVKPKSEVPAEIVECTTKAAAIALTANTDVLELFDAGMSSVYVLPSASLDLDAIINPAVGNFYTILISSDFSGEDFTGMDLGDFDGVIGRSFTVQADAKAYGQTKNNLAFYGKAANGAKSMFYAVGLLLAAPTWGNKQYSDMPYSDDVITLGAAKSLFDDRVGFVISSDNSGDKLGLFTCDTRAVVAPYVIKEITILLQTASVNYIARNEPDYTPKEASLLEAELQKRLDAYAEQTGATSGGTVSISIPVTQDNFEAAGEISIVEPRALWRLEATLATE